MHVGALPIAFYVHATQFLKPPSVIALPLSDLPMPPPVLHSMCGPREVSYPPQRCGADRGAL